MEPKTLAGQLPPDEDLTEIRKPTSLLVAQFFLFPLIIIAICVGIFLLFGYLTYEQRSPHDYLNEIRSGSDQRRWQAAYELSNMISSQKETIAGDRRFVGDAIATYRSSKDDDPRIRQYLSLTIGTLGDKRAVIALIEGLDDSQVENRISALVALGTIGDNAAVPGILKQLKSEDPTVRKVAAYVLGALKDPDAIHDLQVALNDIREDVRWNAAMSLAQLNDASGADLLMKLIDRAYVERLEGMTPEQKNLLLMNAVECLGILKFQPAQDRILALSRNDPDLAVRDASLEALKKY